MNKQCLSIIMLFSFFVLISISGTVSAANLTVNPGGSIQAAVNNASSGDIITVNDNNGSAYTYTENVIINKKVSLQSKNGSNVTVQAANPTNPVFTINSGGSGTCISGFTIKNAANSTGILLNSVTNCTVHNNTIYGNNYGINIFDSSFNNITQNIVKQNNYGLYLTTQCISLEDFCGDEIEWYEEEDYYCFYEYSGIHSDSQGNLIKGNSFNMNTYGLYLKSDECWSDLSEYDNHVLENNIAGNNYGIFAEGVYVWSSEVAQVHFNRIENNILFGIYLNEIGVNATNNWWGSSNSPTISSNNNSDIRPYEDPCYYYSPWLVLGLNANPTNISGRESIITADLTHNSNGNDTSSQGHIPDGIPINFTTNLGTITSPIYTRNGKANSTFNRGLIPSGTATITATLDNQSVQASVIIIADTTQPVVTASLAGGIYNTTKSVTLTASDNLDPNPVIFYSSNNGTTWNSQTNTVTLNLTQGITNLKFYARDASNNTCLNQTITYTIDTTAPTVNANPTGNFYNTPQNVVLSATDNIDHNPVIYYTRDDSTPTTLSTIYTGPININTDTILKFIAVDDAGNQAAVQIQNYIFNFLIMNNNTVKTYSSIQAALDDPMTLNGHVIIVNNGTYIENIILNKNITIMSIQNGNVTLQALNSSKPIFTINSLGSGSTIQGFIITGANDSSAIYINSANNCIINNNELTNNKNGIYLHKSKYNIITGNKLNNHSNIGIYIYPNSDNNNINNNILAFFPYGIYIRNSFNNSITGNTLYNSTTYAIYLNNATNTLTKQNNLTNNNYSIVLSKAQNNTITENSVSKTTNYGIYLDSSSINTLNQNTINTSSSRGIYLTTNSNNNYIQNNILTLNPYGIYLLNSINNILTANIINNSTSYAIYISNATSTTTNQNNLTNNNRGIYLTNTQNNTITGNNLINNTKTGIYLNNSTNNILTDNTAKNSQYGLYIYTNSNNNQLQNNVLTSNQYGIYLYITENNIIKGNNVYNNTYDGIYLYNSSAIVNFNRIVGNGRYGLENVGNGTVNTTNNWWKSNNPIISSANGSDIYIAGGNVTYNPWLVLNLTANPSVVGDENSTLTADLTRNSNGADTSSQGHLPNGIPVNFTTNLGTITTTAYTGNGKANATFNRGSASSGTATVTTTIDNQSIQTNITIIDTIAPTVTASLANGTYNSYQNVTLTVTDNIDQNPHIYYTLDGSTPTTSSILYTAPINIFKNITTLKFMAVDAAGNQAQIQSRNYVINLPIININTEKVYSHIQDAINDQLTINGHTIQVNSGTYTENIIVNKNLTIKAREGNNDITIQAATPSSPVITITSTANGSTIQGFIIKGATDYNKPGIYLNGATNCNITNNILTGNFHGIDFSNSNNNTIQNNTIQNNNWDGLHILNSNNNKITGNTIKNQTAASGIYLNNSNNIITENTITDNDFGIYLYQSSSTIQFNRITNNDICGLWGSAVSITAINNWWGTNNPKISTNYPSDIWATSGTITYNPWIVLTISSSSDIVSHDSSSSVTADLTRNNQGNDTSPYGKIPNGIPINYSTTLGTIGSPASTMNGKSVTTFNSSATAGTATVSATLDKQTVSKTIINVAGAYNQRTKKTFTTIQAAIDDATTLNGDTILVGGGTYTENVIVAKQLILMSAYGKNVTVQPMNSSQPAFTVYSSGSTIKGFNIKGSTNYGIFLYQVNNCNITGNTITNCSGGIFLYYSNNTSISENNATNNTENGIDLYYSNGNMISGNNLESNGLNGIYIDHTNNNTISGNNATKNTLKGIYVDNSKTTTIIRNNATNNKQIGILINNSNSTWISENNIKNNICENIGGGLVLIDTNNTTISTNNLTNNTNYGLLLINSNNNTISSNNATNNTMGINLQKTTNNTISLNNVTSNIQDGIMLLYSSNSILSGNNITNNLNYGICLDNSDNTKITENKITNNLGGIYLYFSPTNVNFNRIVGNTAFGLCNAYSNFVNATNNWWGTNSPTVSSSNSSDIYILGGNIIYDPWIVLNVNSTYITDGISNITVDLTYNNQGTNTLPLGHIPNGTNVNFTTDYGSIQQSGFTVNGKTTSQLNYSSPHNTANITVTLDNQIISKTVNLFKVYNTVSHQGFTTIQAAINAPSTSAGDIIEVASGTYVENIVLTKKLTIRAVPGGTVTLQALNPNLPVFTIKTNGTGSKISGFVINGTNSSFGILLENANECIIENNNINGNFKGIYLFQSSRNSISNNTLFNNTYGIFIPAECTYQISSFSLNNTISQNNIRNNCYGIYLWGDWSGIGFIGGINTIDTSITSNIIYGNVYGVYSNSSQFNMHFNQLSNNTMADLWLEVEEGISFDARNNWWGTSNLIIEWDNYDPEVTYDVYSEGGIDGWYCNDLIYGVIPWLVLNVTANPVITNGNSTVTADLTHNSNGNDTSPQGHVPDGIPIDITTSLGAVTSPVYTRNGKATLTFNSGTVTSGIANITATLDRQSVQTNVTIDKIAPTVNASLSSGLYNTSQSVNLTASDNIDLHPIIYYTTDGSNPTTSSAIYTTSITISTTTTLKFMAVDFTGNQSPVNMVYYIFSPIGNLNTGKGYSSIQNAINDNLTVNGNVIVVRNGTYTENIVVNKKLTITPYNGNVTIQAANLNNPAITINSGGSGSVISGFTLKGANGTSSSGIYLNNASNCTITGNILTGNYYGLLLTNSPNNMIWDNNLTGNLMEGIRFNSSNNNTVYSNTIINNSGTGIYIGNSLYSLIMENTIQNNLMNGIELNNSSNSTVYENTIMNNHQSGIKATSSSASINFNIIAENTVYGLYNLVNGTVNATNNWWGTNNLTVSSTNGSSIYIAGGTVLYNPWLVMNLTGSVIYVTHNSTSSSEITADITHNNQGKDTSGSGRIPDGLPVNFTTTLGTINSTATVRSGKARVTLTSSPSSGATTVTATLGNYSVSRAFHKSFSTIQGAVSDPLTVDGDVIFVTNGTYVENIVINKNLTIVSEGNVTVQASNISSPVFTVNNCSDSMIYGFKITGATNSSAIYLNRANNCYILDNTITGNGLSSTGDFGYGIFLNSTTNCTVSGNILQGNLGGIDLEYSNNTLLSGNNITGSTFRGVYLYQANYTTISESNLANNDCGILACYSNNLKVTSNDVKNNTYHGIYLYYSSGDLHFNRIVGNGQYGLLSRGGTVNATNNWWGTNNPVVSSAKPSAIYVISGSVLYNPRLVLTITPTSYKVADGKVYEATITADLNHNSNNEDLSTVIYTPDGIPVTFISNNNSNITSTSYTEDGKASATLILNPNLQSGFTNVTATLDSQSASTSVDRIAKATIIISSTAIDLSTNHSLYLTYEVPLNESVSWVSVLWKSKSCDFGSFQNEVDLIVNGVVVLNKTVSNINYLINHDSFSPKVWYNVNFLNWLFSESTESKNALKSIIYQNPGLQNLTGSALETGLLNMIREKNGFNDSEMFVIANYKYFKDNITTIISYPGDAGKKISFEDPDSGEVVGINFPGNPIYRESTMIYANGGYFHVDNRNDPTSRVYKNEGYEGVRSFAIVTTKVTDEMLRYWLDEKDRTNANGTLLYPEGPMKAAYGTFLESLLVIKCHDIVADAAANKYNVTWSRTTPIVVSVCDDAYATYITGEMSHRMGMDVVGDPANVKAFRYACSSSFSLVEYWVGQALFPSDNPSSNLLGSVTLGLGYKMLNGEPLEIFESNGYTIIRAVGDNQRLLIIDPATGIVMDIGTTLDLNDTISGTRCYGDQQTEWANGYGNAILDNEPAIKRAAETGEDVVTDWGQDDMGDTVLGLASSVAISVGVAMLVCSGPPGWLALAVIGLGVAGSYFASDLDEGWTTSRWINFGLNVGPSLIPFIGAEGGVAGRLGISYVTKTGAKKMVTTISGNSESYVITNMPKWGGGTFTGGYMSTVEYVKYGTTKRVIRTAFGDTEQEAAKNALKYTVLPSRVAVIVNNYSPEIDYYGSVTYDNISDYFATV